MAQLKFRQGNKTEKTEKEKTDMKLVLQVCAELVKTDFSDNPSG